MTLSSFMVKSTENWLTHEDGKQQVSSHDEAEYCNSQIKQTDCYFAALVQTKNTGSNSTEQQPKATTMQLSKVPIRVLLRNKEPQQRGEKKLMRRAHLSIIYFEFVWVKGLTICTHASLAFIFKALQHMKYSQVSS